MEVQDAIIVAVKVAGKNVMGRTAIQKLIYFLSIFEIVDAKYRPHYYGPYSVDVASSIQMLSSMDFLSEKVETSETIGYTVPENRKRYLYSVSTDGEQFFEDVKRSDREEIAEISRIVEISRDTVNFNPDILSWAAKVNYILTKKNELMTHEAIISTADSFSWKLSSEQVDMALELLGKLGLSK